MPALYSPEWVAAFNAAVADLDVGSVDTGASLTAAEGRFRVAQEIHDGPTGDLRIVLVVADGHLALALAPAEADGGSAGPDDTGRVNVTLSLDYRDAVALSRGEVEPSALVGTGRVRVRGDLSVLVAGQALLAAAAPRLADLQAATTY